MSAVVKEEVSSRRIYVEGNESGVRVPFREIHQKSPTQNSPVRVYDTSGPWGDPELSCDVRKGLPALRREWITGRGDVTEYEGREVKPIDDGYLTFNAANQARTKDKGRLEDFPTLRRSPLRAKPSRCVTQLHYARQGIVT